MLTGTREGPLKSTFNFLHFPVPFIFPILGSNGRILSQCPCAKGILIYVLMCSGHAVLWIFQGEKD